MKWYSKYLSVFEKPFDDNNTATIQEVRTKLQKLQSNQPLVSVVVIAHNEEQRLLACLWSLSESTTSYPLEIIGVENNSSDRTAAVFEASGIPWYFEEKKSCGHARNCGRMHAKGKYYICIDSDTMYPPLYIEMLVRKLEKPGIVAVSSLWSFVPDKKFPTWQLFLYEKARDLNLWLQSFNRPELSVRGMVFAYNLEYGRKIEYRCDIIRGEDGMMAFGLKKYGKIAFVRNKKARAMSSSNILYAQGSMYNAIKIRLKLVWKRLSCYFVKATIYKDQDTNLIKNK
jgi:glycosyltransferase involved in cell wall biosynthesis